MATKSILTFSDQAFLCKISYNFLAISTEKKPIKISCGFYYILDGNSVVFFKDDTFAHCARVGRPGISSLFFLGSLPWGRPAKFSRNIPHNHLDSWKSECSCYCGHSERRKTKAHDSSLIFKDRKAIRSIRHFYCLVACYIFLFLFLIAIVLCNFQEWLR